MPVSTNAKRITKIWHGSDLVFEDTSQNIVRLKMDPAVATGFVCLDLTTGEISGSFTLVQKINQNTHYNLGTFPENHTYSGTISVQSSSVSYANLNVVGNTLGGYADMYFSNGASATIQANQRLTVK